MLLLLIGVCNVLILRANLDLTDGRHVLFMDEQISFDGVRRILHPEGFGDLLDAIFVGSDFRYGRIFWNLAALVSWLPEKIFGPPGQIVATRFLQHALLLAAYILLAWTFLKRDVLRWLLIFLLLILPGTAYFAHMPKPEPTQLFFLALFLFYYINHSQRFGWYYVFLGLAFGAKISLLPLVLVFIGLSGLANYNNLPGFSSQQFGFLTLSVHLENRWSKMWVAAIKAGVFFLLGLIIANPFLILSFLSPEYFKNYLSNTLLNTTHGSDDLSVSVIDWLRLLFGDLLGPPSILLLMIFLICLANLFFQLYLRLFAPKSSAAQLPLSGKLSIFVHDFRGLTAIITLVLLLPIMLFIKRTWDFYLHPGLIFGVVLTLITIEKGYSEDFKLARWGAALLTGLILVSSPFSLFQSSRTLNNLANRTQSSSHQLKLKQYHYLDTFLTELSQRAFRKLTVIYDPNLYLLDSTENYEILRFFGYKLAWEDRREVIVFYQSILMNLSPSNILYSQYLAFMELYRKYVVEKSEDFYYEPYESEFEDLIILVRNDLLSYLNKE